MPAGGGGLGRELLLLSATLLSGLQVLQIKLAQLSNCLNLSSIKWKYVYIKLLTSLCLSENLFKKINQFYLKLMRSYSRLSREFSTST